MDAVRLLVSCHVPEFCDLKYAVVSIDDETRELIRRRSAAFKAARAEDDHLDEMRYLHDYAAVYYKDDPCPDAVMTDVEGVDDDDVLGFLPPDVTIVEDTEDAARSEMDTMIIAADYVQWTAADKYSDDWSETPRIPYEVIFREPPAYETEE